MIHSVFGVIETRPGPCVPVQTGPGVGYTSDLVEQLFVSTLPERMRPELGDWACQEPTTPNASEIAAFVNRPAFTD